MLFTQAQDCGTSMIVSNAGFTTAVALALVAWAIAPGTSAPFFLQLYCHVSRGAALDGNAVKRDLIQSRFSDRHGSGAVCKFHSASSFLRIIER